MQAFVQTASTGYLSVHPISSQSPVIRRAGLAVGLIHVNVRDVVITVGLLHFKPIFPA
jgi:hypothetical protein